jgi:hypothetical protein
LDSAAGDTFMSITLGATTKLLDDMMINYSEWHTEKTPQGKQVNSIEETSSLSDNKKNARALSRDNFYFVMTVSVLPRRVSNPKID